MAKLQFTHGFPVPQNRRTLHCTHSCPQM